MEWLVLLFSLSSDNYSGHMSWKIRIKRLLCQASVQTYDLVRMMTSPSVLVLVTLVSFVSKTCAITSCPRIVKVERGTNYSITCIADTNVNDFYWYKGLASNQDLVGKLENGLKSISEQYKDDYDVSLSGGLVILNAGIIHESRYDLVTFNANGNPEEEGVIVNITISPDFPCPHINNCTSCEQCKLPQTKKSGTLTCKVEGSRPHVPLKWNTVSQNGISVLAYRPQIQQSDVSLDSWDSSVSLEYKITALCEAQLVLQCVAEDTQHILNSTVSTIEISSDQCNTIPIYGSSPPVIQPTPPPVISPTSPSSSSTFVPILVVLIIALLIGVIVFIFIFIRRRNKREGEIVRLLKDGYEQFCYLQPLPWGDGIHIAALYTDNNCKVTDSNCTVTDKSEISYISSKDLRKSKSILSRRLVIFMGERGDGRTTFLKQVVYEWLKDTIEDIFLLIFIPLKDVKTDKALSKFLIEDILKTSKIKSGHVEAILQAKNCLVILDGLEDLPESFRNGVGDAGNQTEDAETLVTIGELIQGKRNGTYSNLLVWISSREADCTGHWSPKSYVKVEMERFSKDQFTTYVQNCCKYYVSCTQKADRTVTYVPSNDSTSEITLYREEITEECNDVSNKVQNFLEENNVLSDYENSPLLINLMVHILAAKYTSAYSYLNDVKIINMTTLLRLVIICMKKRYVNKNPSSSVKDFNDLENKLGEVALEEKTNIAVKGSDFWVKEKEIGEENVKTACKIGFLKLTKESPSTARFAGIEFHHMHIQEYLAASFILSTGACISNYEQILEQCGEDKRERIKRMFNELRHPILNVL